MDRYCKRCKTSRPFKTIKIGSGNSEIECTVCGWRHFLIQGFDMDLM